MADDSISYRLHIHTDASKSGDNVGYGWAATIDDFIVAEDVRSAKEINIYKAEVMAINEALSWLKDIGCQDHNIKIMSNSQSAVMAIRGYEASDPLMRDTMVLLRELTDVNNVQLCWVKGHSNVTGNELADMLANKGREEANYLEFPTPFHPIDVKDVKKMVASASVNKWQEEWSSHVDHRVSRLFIPSVSIQKHTSSLQIGDLQRLSHIVTGHGLFKRHLRHWNELPRVDCSLCGETDEDTWHLWAYCPTLSRERAQINAEIANGLSIERALLKMFKTRKICELIASNEAVIEPG